IGKQRPVPPVVAAGEDATRRVRLGRAEELEVDRPRMACATLETRRSEIAVQALARPVGQAPCTDRAPAEVIRVESAARPLFAQPAVQVAVPQQGGAGE